MALGAAYAQLLVDSFYLSDEALLDSPSLKDGIDQETEFMLRLYGCELIQEGGILLKLCVSPYFCF